MTLARLVDGAASFGLALDSQQVEAFSVYRDLLLDWSRRVNLTAILDPDEIEVRHFLDALSCFRFISPSVGARVIDIGTGAGLPGLALKIAAPDLHVTLVDSVAKKADFLKAAVATLGLDNVSVQVGRAETLGQMAGHRNAYEWAVARGVARLPILLEYLLPLVCVGGHVLAMKGDTASEEVVASQSALEELGGGAPIIERVDLPGQERPHYLVCVPKIRETPSRYPRRPGVPSKRPL